MFDYEGYETRSKHGHNITGRKRSDEHTEAAAGTDEQLQPEVPSTSGRLGETTAIGVKFSGKVWYQGKNYGPFTN